MKNSKGIGMVIMFITLMSCSKKEPFYDLDGLMMRESWSVSQADGRFEILDQTNATFEFHKDDSLSYFYLGQADTVYNAGTWYWESTEPPVLHMEIENTPIAPESFPVILLELNNLVLTAGQEGLFLTNKESL